MTDRPRAQVEEPGEEFQCAHAMHLTEQDVQDDRQLLRRAAMLDAVFQPDIESLQLIDEEERMRVIRTGRGSRRADCKSGLFSR